MINGFVNLSGEQGGTASGQDSGGGGAGSGGHLILYGSSIDVSSSTVNVSGGRGGSATGTGTDDAGGGGGSGGRVYIVYSTLTNTSVTYLATGGVAGSGGKRKCTGFWRIWNGNLQPNSCNVHRQCSKMEFSNDK